MIGNDVIDLKLALKQSNWQRQGFLNKIYTQSEQTCIYESNNPFQMVWLLWSMKESTYKAYLQKNPERFFNPKKLECLLKNNKLGTVRINNYEYLTKSEETEDYIHTVATLNEEGCVTTNCFETGTTYEIQHNLTYNKLLEQVSYIKTIPQDTLKIKKDSIGIPKVYSKNESLNLTISMSHHGNYGAFVILN